MQIVNGNKCFFFLFIIMLIIPQSRAQDTIVLKAYECAIVKLHMIDDCPCSHIDLFVIDGHERHDNFVKVNIDSVLLIHVASDFINNRYLQEEIKYLSIPDSIDLRKDTSFIASIGIEFDMNYVVFNYFVEQDVVFIENKRYPIQAGFACESGFSQSPACQHNGNKTAKCIEECDKKYSIGGRP